MTRIRQHYDGAHGIPALGSAGDYSAVFASVLPDAEARRQYLRQLLEGRSPCFGQRVLGAAIAAGLADLIITTNFDELIERSAREAPLCHPTAPLGC
jgi:hypothetical protein